MKLVVAVSGGIDSVVLLHMLVAEGGHELVVAHFDHGIRQDSSADARFVEALAGNYSLPFEMKREELGEAASEDLARQRRYVFLKQVAEKYGAKLATAHHLDDVVETVALNLARGTSWRGLAGLSDKQIYRPLTKRTKSELKEYALGERLEWVEDETNFSEQYARNKIRKLTAALSVETKLKIYDLWQNQLRLRGEIGRELERGDFPIFSRYFMTMLEWAEAREIIYSLILIKFGTSLLSHQLESMWLAIKVGRPGTNWQIGQGVVLSLERDKWSVKLAKR